MKYNKSIFIIAISLLAFAGCNKKAKQDDNNITTEDVSQQKQDFIVTINQRIDKIDNQMDELKSKIGDASADKKEELQDRWVKLKEERGQLKDNVQKLKESDDSNWEKTKDDINDQWDAFQSDFNDLKDDLGIS